MNKYFVSIPYSYLQYGMKRGVVYAESESEVEDLVREDCISDDDFEDTDSDSTHYCYDDIDIELEEEDVEPPEVQRQPSRHSSEEDNSIITAKYFLEDIHKL